MMVWAFFLVSSNQGGNPDSDCEWTMKEITST